MVQLLRTMQRMIGLPIVSMATGKEIGQICDGCMCDGRIAGFIIKRNHALLHHHGFLPFEAIQHLGEQAVMIDEDTKVENVADTHKQYDPICTSRKKFKGKPVLSSEGDMLGLAEDVYFSMEVGTIIGYEVTDGWLSDIKEGRKVVKGHDLLLCKERAILSL